jgi:hypothetical protein
VKRIALLALLGVAACGPGSKYDDLTGGSKEDQALTAPRPLSPLSVTMVSTSRPRLKWDLTGSATGAIVELCRTRACDGDVKRYEATGRELVVPEDLEPGIWFWRLTSRTEKTHGTATSATWEVLVRGPAAHGSSDAPTGAVVDYDGDGHADLLFVADLAVDSDGTPGPAALGMKGNEGATLDEDMDSPFPIIGPSTPDVIPYSVAAGTDFDGDGFADMGFGTATLHDGSWVDIEFGGVKAFDETKVDFQSGLTIRGVPTIKEAGDIDGDGYGDLLTSDSQSIIARKGGANGASGFSPILQVFDDPSMPAPKVDIFARALAIGGAFDSNGDGFTDAAFGFPTGPDKLPFTSSTLSVDKQPALHGAGSGSAELNAPANPYMMLAPGSAGLFNSPTARWSQLSVPGAGSVPVALTFAAGDFNGDGIADVAGTVKIGSTRHVCVWFGDVERVVEKGSCVTAPAYDTTLGDVLTTADLEGDGVDELLAVSSEQGSSVQVLRFDTELKVAQTIPNLGNALTTIWPGRPGLARWAARAADGQSIKVYEGTHLVQTVRPTPDVVRGFGRVIR